jgi:hypothetical protein
LTRGNKSRYFAEKTKGEENENINNPAVDGNDIARISANDNDYEKV